MAGIAGTDPAFVKGKGRALPFDKNDDHDHHEESNGIKDLHEHMRLRRLVSVTNSIPRL